MLDIVHIIDFKYVIIATILVGGAIASPFIISRYNKRYKENISFKKYYQNLELPIISLYNNNIRLNFLVDSGSNISYIDTNIFNDYKLEYKKLDKSINCFGLEGVETIGNYCEITFYFNKLKFKETLVMNDLSQAFNKIEERNNIRIHGILGSDFLMKYKYNIDYKNMIIYQK